MGLITKLFGTAPSPRGPAKRWELVNGYTPVFHTYNGELYESELVRASIDARARHISKLAFSCEGEGKPALQRRMRRAPNDWQSWSQFLYRLSSILDVKNTAFIVPVFGEYGETTGIASLWVNDWELVEYEGEPWIRFILPNRQTVAIELSRVGIMTSRQLKSDYFGENNNALAPTMDLIGIQNQGIKEGVKSSASFRFMATLSNWSTNTDLKKERQKFVRENLEDGGDLLLWPNTYKDIKQIESKPYIADSEQMKLIQDSVHGYFGVSKDILENCANDQTLGSFYDGAVEPFAIQLSEVLTRMLFSLRERELGNRVVMTANRLQYMSTTAKTAVVKEMTSVGAMSIDEIREMFNYAPIGGEAGAFMPVRGEYYNLLEGKKNE